MTPYLRQSLAFEPTSIKIGLLSSQQQNEFITDSSNLHHLSIDGSFLKSTFGAHNYVTSNFSSKSKKKILHLILTGVCIHLRDEAMAIARIKQFAAISRSLGSPS